jgi:hypothetical protein
MLVFEAGNARTFAGADTSIWFFDFLNSGEMAAHRLRRLAHLLRQV